MNDKVKALKETLAELEERVSTYSEDAIKNVFGDRAQDIQVSSCKSMLGHMLGASGAVEAAITALTIKKELITPTINLENPDPACEVFRKLVRDDDKNQPEE